MPIDRSMLESVDVIPIVLSGVCPMSSPTTGLVPDVVPLGPLSVVVVLFVTCGLGCRPIDSPTTSSVSGDGGVNPRVALV